MPLSPSSILLLALNVGLLWLLMDRAARPSADHYAPQLRGAAGTGLGDGASARQARHWSPKIIDSRAATARAGCCRL